MMARAPEADAIVMAAAVADYTVDGGPAAEKRPKDAERLELTLVRTRDILADLGRWRAGRRRPVLVGFAAETSNVVEKARAKLQAKGADLIVANDVSRRDAGFEVDANAAWIVSADRVDELPLMAKRELAARILDRVMGLLAEAEAAPAGTTHAG
jgi:phosphopantothenoylcysteine decarboxylase/phosphopantothenate--cysteine ligase